MTDTGKVIARVLFPAEHGAWGWLLIPFAAGAIVGGTWNIPLTLFLAAVFSGFLVRQPAVIWLRSLSGKSDPARGRIARNLTIVLLLLSSVFMIPLLLLRVEMIWFAGTFAFLLAFYVHSNLKGRKALRSLWTELVGSAALAGVAPATILAANGSISAQQWAFGAWMAVLNVLGVLYVRLRIADTHRVPYDRFPTAAAHLLGLVLVSLLCYWMRASQLVVLPFAAISLRALWFSARPIAVPNMKRFGFTELFVELFSAFWIAFATLQ